MYLFFLFVRCLLVCSWCLVFLFLNTSKVKAIDFGIAYGIEIDSQENDEILDGHIVSLRSGKYGLSTTEYEEGIYGVVDLSPNVLLDLSDGQSGTPVVNDGQSYILVNLNNGIIEPGDWITSSNVAGEGMRADKKGTVVGQALESFPSEGQDLTRGRVLVGLNIYNLGAESTSDTNLLGILVQGMKDIFSFTALAANEEPSLFFRFILAALVVIIAIIFSYFTFGRVARSGIEAVGRNPLARTPILLGVVFNVLVASLIILSGLGVAYYIIRL